MWLCAIQLSTLSIVTAQEYPVLFTQQKNNIDNLYVYHQGQAKAITSDNSKDSSPMLSPDGKAIVFTSERVGWWKIWSLDVAKESFTQLTDSKGAQYAPAWSPDGSQIVYVSSQQGGSALYIMNADGTSQRRLTPKNTFATMPFWGNDNQIYFSSKVSGLYQIAQISPKGSNMKVLTDSKGNKLMPQPHPKGKGFLYYGDADGDMEIYTASIDGKKITRLTHHKLQDIRPRWSLDGKKIVFERGDKRKNQHIYIMNSDGSEQTQLTFSGYNYAPSFAHNCDRLC